MDDDEAFLRAIGANPDDRTARLVYADWLEERGDSRAEYVRVQARVMESPGDGVSLPDLWARQEQLRADCPPYWLARLDPPVWCAVGNIIDVRQAAAGAEPLRGTRLFRPNAKVFLTGYTSWYALLDLAPHPIERIEVVGQHRKSREWIKCWVRVGWTTNWRVKLIRDPGAMVRLREDEWAGFRLRPHQFQPPTGATPAENLRALFETLRAA